MIETCKLKYFMMVVQLTRVQLCDPKDCSQPGSSVCEISQARILVCCYFLIPGSGRSSREENDIPHRYSCLGNPTDRGPWRATVRGVAKSQTRISDQRYITLLPSSRGSSQPRDRTHVSSIAGSLLYSGVLFTTTREAHQVLA